MMNMPTLITMTAYSQIWHFTSAALAALKPFGMGAPATLTNLILQLSPTDGFGDGDYYEFAYQGAGLSRQVQGEGFPLTPLRS